MKILITGLACLLICQSTLASIFINEFHYDNEGSDIDEAIELLGSAGMDLSGWKLLLYNGSNGSTYSEWLLSGTFSDQANGFGTLSFSESSLQNGGPDGIALVNALGEALEFISYEGSFIASDGPAIGLSSVDIGLSESNSPIGMSLQRFGSGLQGNDFAWQLATASFGAINENQLFDIELDVPDYSDDSGTDNPVSADGSVPTPGALSLFCLGSLMLATYRCRLQRQG